MFGRLGPLEIGIIVLVLLLLFGATRLPKLGQAMGKTISEFRSGLRAAADEVEHPGADKPPTAKPPAEKGAGPAAPA